MILFVLLLFLYAALITQLAFGISKINKQKTIEISSPKTTFSIVVPFRNEAENLPLLLESLEKLKYPTELFEVILVDDESQDKFQVSSFKFQVVQKSNNLKLET